MVGPVSRRGLLLAGGVALAGCGSKRSVVSDEPPPRPRSSQQEGDAEVLLQLIAAEQVVADVAGGKVASHARAHEERLRTELRRLGGGEGYSVSTSDDLRPVLEEAVATYIDGIPKLYDRRLRGLAASIVAVHAEHLAHLDGDRATEAFVLGSHA